LIIFPFYSFAETDEPAQSQAGYEGVSTSLWYETDPLFFGRSGSNYFNGGVVFENVEIPAGSTVTSATLSVYQSGSCLAQMSLDIYAIAADNFSAFSSANRPSNTTKTTNFNNYPNTCLATQVVDFENLETVINEVISRPGWIAGNHLAFALIASAPATAFFQVYVTDEFVLEMEYTLPPDNTMLDCQIPANDDISIITGCRNIYGSTTASSTITATEFYKYYSPGLLLFFIFLVLVLIATIFIIWILWHDIHS